jgi:hypothetical protein
MDGEFSRAEIEGALTERAATNAAYEVMIHPSNKSAPGWKIAQDMIEAAIEAAFGPK